MARRPSKTDPELQAHKYWLGYLQPSGHGACSHAYRWAGRGHEQGVMPSPGRERERKEVVLRSPAAVEPSAIAGCWVPRLRPA